MSTLWDQTLAELQTALPSQEYAVWISCLRTSSDVSDTLRVEAPSTFHRNWIQRHFLERIRVAVESVAGKPVPVVLAVAGGATAPAPPPAPIRAPTSAPSIGAQALVFETFVVGPCNELAHAAATTVSHAPGTQYNPLFIHGGVGLGKTHLIHATANALRAGFRSARVLAIGAELFVNEMVSAVRRQQMETFHQRFRRIDTLLVDDVQFIAGKERTQEEFLHTFNLLCAAGKQIVVSSDKPPRAIPNLEAGLRSRFEGGMIAEVTAPDRATRARILERKAALAGLDVPAAVLEYLADRIRASSVRELEGALTRLRAVATLSGRPVDLELAEEVIGPMYPDARRRASEGRIEELVAAAVGVDVRALASGRDVRVVFARQVAMYLMRKHMSLSFGTIGERYGRDHTTVLHAARAIETRRGCDPEVRRLVSALEEKL
jgi:chromosomal replication initiator protein